MLPIVVVGLVAVVAILAWQGSASDKKRVAAKLRQAQAAKPPPKVAPRPARDAPQTLEKDPKTGVYKLRE
jgi:Mg2+/citrate symporter